MSGLHGCCSEVHADDDGRRVIYVKRFESFSLEELLSLMGSLNESSSWSPVKGGLLKEMREAYMKKLSRLRSGVGGGE